MNNYNQDVVLSICIASFNHGASLAQKIRKMLSYGGLDFEVVISDNCSTDNTVNILSEITDTRLKLITASTNKGPSANYTKALAAGSGKYVMFMTDKDDIVYENIGFVINVLKQQEFSCGFFALDYAATEQKIIYCFDLENCLKNFAYLSKHPTGYIYNRKLLCKLDIEKNFSNTEIVGFFPFEFICAELCLFRRCAILNIRFCVTAKLVLGHQKERSMTYSGKKKNIFFAPAARFETFEKYCNHLNSLKISRRIRLNVLQNLLVKSYKLCVYEYPRIIKSEAHRIHYDIADDDLLSCDENNIRNFFIRSLRRTSAFKDHIEKSYILSKNLFL